MYFQFVIIFVVAFYFGHKTSVPTFIPLDNTLCFRGRCKNILWVDSKTFGTPESDNDATGSGYVLHNNEQVSHNGRQLSSDKPDPGTGRHLPLYLNFNLKKKSTPP